MPLGRVEGLRLTSPGLTLGAPSPPEGPRPQRETLTRGSHCVLASPSGSVPPGLLKSTNQSETWRNRRGRVGRHPTATSAPTRSPELTQVHCRDGASCWPCALLQARGVTPHVPVGGQTPARDTKGKVTPEGGGTSTATARHPGACIPVGWGGGGQKQELQTPASQPTHLGACGPHPPSLVLCVWSCPVSCDLI